MCWPTGHSGQFWGRSREHRLEHSMARLAQCAMVGQFNSGSNAAMCGPVWLSGCVRTYRSVREGRCGRGARIQDKAGRCCTRLPRAMPGRAGARHAPAAPAAHRSVVADDWRRGGRRRFVRVAESPAPNAARSATRRELAATTAMADVAKLVERITCV